MIMNDKFYLQAKWCEKASLVSANYTLGLCNRFFTDFRSFLKSLRDKISEWKKYTSCTERLYKN